MSSRQIPLPPTVATLKPHKLDDNKSKFGRPVEGVVTSVSVDSVDLTLDDGRPAVIHRTDFGLRNEAPSDVLSIGDKAIGVELSREDPRNRVVLSRSFALKKRVWENLIASKESGDLIAATVVALNKNGATIDAGVKGFVPSGHLELADIAEPESYIGKSFKFKIIDLDAGREKLVLSRRAELLKAQRSESKDHLKTLKVGQLVSGKVSSLTDFGAFVDLGHGVDGLIHVSELSWAHVSKAAEVCAVGDEVRAKVLEVGVKKKRVGLSLRQTQTDPLRLLEVGEVIEGSVVRLAEFGVFVTISINIAPPSGTKTSDSPPDQIFEFEGLVHLSELAEYRVNDASEIVMAGDQVSVKIISVDTERRRVQLSLRQAAEFGG